jgi:hypothetical protein
VKFENGTSAKGEMGYFPPFDGTQDSRKYGNYEIEEGSEEDEESMDNCPCPGHWKTKAYYNLPENVRNAIDIAKTKSKHSEFWYKLQTLNDKIFVYRSVYYSKMPAFQKAFIEKKQAALELKLKEERLRFEAEMKEIDIA